MTQLETDNMSGQGETAEATSAKEIGSGQEEHERVGLSHEEDGKGGEVEPMRPSGSEDEHSNHEPMGGAMTSSNGPVSDIQQQEPSTNAAVSGTASQPQSRTPSVTIQVNAPPSRGPSIETNTKSSRSSHQTSSGRPTLMSLGRDKLRYSWQSVKEDEPTRPRINIIKLLSDTASSSAGFPGGEAFRFSFSPSGRRIAVYNSARIYVLDTLALPVGVSQDYALKRRPVAVEILDRDHTIAVLADPHTVNIYSFEDAKLQRTRMIKLDFPASCIALEPSGGLLAAAYEGGVEVFSLEFAALPTDRRAVRCQNMDRLYFSADGSTLLGTTVRINTSATVIVSVPIFPAAEDGVATHQELKEAWCTGLLHPENIRNSSHAVFFRQHKRLCNDRLLAWNGGADTFGLLHVESMQYGNVEFPVVISPPLSTCGGLGAAIHSCPSVDEAGNTVAMIINDRTIRLYIVPHVAEDDEEVSEAHSIDHELDEGHGCPFTEVRWVHSSSDSLSSSSSSSSAFALPFRQSNMAGRLVVASPGGVVEDVQLDEFGGDIEGGRIIVFDFDPQLACQPGQTFVLSLGKGPPQVLEEAPLDVATEVAIVRRRTVNQRKSGTFSQRPLPMGRSATTRGRGRPPVINEEFDHVLNSGFVRSGGPVPNIQSSGKALESQAERDALLMSESDGVLLQDGGLWEDPYIQNAPRSQVTMQRAASNAQRHRFQTFEEIDRERVYVGADVESSGHILPLPEYTAEPNAPLPSRFRIMAGLDAVSPSGHLSSSILDSHRHHQHQFITTTTTSSSSPSLLPPHNNSHDDINNNNDRSSGSSISNQATSPGGGVAVSNSSLAPDPHVRHRPRSGFAPHAPITDRIDEEDLYEDQPSPNFPPDDDNDDDENEDEDDNHARHHHHHQYNHHTLSMRHRDGHAADVDASSPITNTFTPTGTFDSTSTLPRSLHRAYTTAAAAGFPLPSDSDPDNVHPSVTNVMRHSFSARDYDSETGTLDPISPVGETYLFGRRSVATHHAANGVTNGSKRSSIHEDQPNPRSLRTSVYRSGTSGRHLDSSANHSPMTDMANLVPIPPSSSRPQSPATSSNRPRPFTSTGSNDNHLSGSAWRPSSASKTAVRTRSSGAFETNLTAVDIRNGHGHGHGHATETGSGHGRRRANSFDQDLLEQDEPVSTPNVSKRRFRGRNQAKALANAHAHANGVAADANGVGGTGKKTKCTVM